MRNAWIWIVVVVVAIGGGLLWWQSSQQNAASQEMPTIKDEASDYMPEMPAAVDTATTSATTSTETTVAPTAPAATTGSVKEIAVASKGFAFTPNTITVKAGDKVKITYTNGGGTHDFEIEGYNVETKVIQGGQSDTVEFTADKVGTFEFFCSVGSHRAMGMKGKFIVTP